MSITTLPALLGVFALAFLALSRLEQASACREVREQLEALKLQHAEVRWLGVSSALWRVESDLAAYAKENGVTLPLALDGAGVVADATGKIVSRIEGNDGSLAQVLSTIAQELK